MARINSACIVLQNIENCDALYLKRTATSNLVVIKLFEL